MNRRELMKLALAAVASTGFTGAACHILREPKPALLTLDEQIARQWQKCKETHVFNLRKSR